MTERQKKVIAEALKIRDECEGILGSAESDVEMELLNFEKAQWDYLRAAGDVWMAYQLMEQEEIEERKRARKA